jgi:hypothetical protein
MSEREWPRLRAEGPDVYEAEHGGRVVTLRPPWGEPDERAVRLARLFAQAPTLYEAAREAERTIDGIYRDISGQLAQAPHYQGDGEDVRRARGYAQTLLYLLNNRREELRAALAGIEAPPSAPTSPPPTPSCSHPACPRPPLSGGRRCEGHQGERGGACLVSGCGRLAHDFSAFLLCDPHNRAWCDAPGEGATAFRAWLARVGAEAPDLRCCEVAECGREAIPGGRLCYPHIDQWEHVLPRRCAVFGCAETERFGGPLCIPHRGEFVQSGLRTPAGWIAHRAAQARPSTPSLPPPVPGSPGNAYTTHGAPVGTDAVALEEALREGARGLEAWTAEAFGRADAALAEGRALLSEGARPEAGASDLRGLAAREAQGGNRAEAASNSLHPCLWIDCFHRGCEDYRVPGSPFCAAHETEGQAALHAEFMDALPEEEREAERAEIERLVSIGRGIIASHLPRPCVNAQCPHERAPRLPGSAFCAGCKP